MKVTHIAVQASSTSWTGGKDICMNFIEGKPVIYWTIKRIIESIENVSVTIIAPEFDRNGDFDSLLDQFGNNKIRITYSHNDSPLERLTAAFEHLEDSEHVIRVDGLNFAFNLEDAMDMHRIAQKYNYDLVKFPDDFPIHFTCDIYKIIALRKLKKMLTSEEAIYKVHPKYYLIMHPEQFSSKYYDAPSRYSDELLKKHRNTYKNVFAARQDGIKHRISAGDQLSFHYEIAAQFLTGEMEALDIACGEGYGSRILAERAKAVIGSDYDSKTIETAKEINKSIGNLSFSIEDAMNTTFQDGRFDLIASMETIEHVPNEESFMIEIRRILRKDGYFIFSTPQNSMGHIPMNNEHIKEYSLEQVVSLAKKYFKVEKVIGIKQGRIILPDDPKGTNTMLICKNSIKKYND